MLGISPGKPPKFVKNFMEGKSSIEAAIKAYVRDVKAGRFPGPEHGFAS
jgi:3-methyl-2-oxobutanoate hydroxymethyltransferase